VEVTKKQILIGRPSALRHTNALSILRLLRETGSCSRADLVRASGLSAPTVTNVVKDLLAANLIEPLGEGESSGGRPPDMIRFKAERGCLLAVDITASRILYLLANLDGSEIDAHETSLIERKTTPEAICGYIAEAAKLLLRRQRMTKDQLLLLVAGVPAITDVDDGIVLSISTLQQWRSVPLRTMLGKLVACPVIVENDTNLASQGERFRGAAKNETNFIFISIGPNVGAGIVLNGRIHHGSQWSAGEIGYLRLPNMSRRNPTIHEFGELETVLSSSGIVASWHEHARKSSASECVSAREILDMAQAGEKRAERIAQQRASIVSDIIVNLSLVLNPNLILMGGEVGSHPELIRLVSKQLEGSEFAVTRIDAGTLGSKAILWGGIASALEVLPDLLLPQPLN
jgi:glucokinase